MNREDAIATVRTEFNRLSWVPCQTPDRCGSKICTRFLELLNRDSPPAPAFRIEAKVNETTGFLTTVAVTEPESILQEAHRLTHGDRRTDYGHPLDDYTRTARMASALLAHKLKEPLTADEMALIMVCVKLSRQVNRPKRDNMVDGAGYCWVAQECIDETERRKK